MKVSGILFPSCPKSINSVFDHAPFLYSADVQQWDRIMAVNLRGPMLAYKFAGRQMVKQGRGGRLIGTAELH